MASFHYLSSGRHTAVIVIPVIAANATITMTILCIALTSSRKSVFLLFLHPHDCIRKRFLYWPVAIPQFLFCLV